MKSKIYFSGLLLFSFIWNVKSQSLTLSGGESESSSGGSISSSIGLSPATVAWNGSYTVSSGSQQPYEISMHLSVVDIKNKNIDIKIYPNPFSENVSVKFSQDYKKEKYDYRIFDLNGRLIIKGELRETANILNLQNLSIGNYILEINQFGITINTYKIIKK
ncbi:T9SS type A sorting domain-containing protein [Epilithonimonas zeae]|uniref:Por secretion system C-terminal sorting domain-containing protein n=1 Tax=Epilithonimonas zeae TaxID=1416779 RepID=A0A1N6EDK5_9FLAO|nr:T9SS type A sorting domain-containing protein [Epilithonimonas zeae]SIN81135.1 Por secretion system C-terminal sorting domain-containing protein [Epilithonimonas zeae]